MRGAQIDRAEEHHLREQDRGDDGRRRTPVPRDRLEDIGQRSKGDDHRRHHHDRRTTTSHITPDVGWGTLATRNPQPETIACDTGKQ